MAAACECVLQYGMDESQSLWRRVLGRPAAENQRTVWQGHPPKLRTAHAAGGAARREFRRWRGKRVLLKDFVNGEHWDYSNVSDGSMVGGAHPSN
jgi:hypothetical protein